MSDKIPTYDHGDFCVRTSLYVVGKTLQNKLSERDYEWMNIMIKECRLDKWTGHRKSEKYRWSNSGGSNAANNTLFKRPTKWIYDHVFKYIGFNPYKGLNGDQYRAYFMWLYLNKDLKGALKVMLGYVYRLGFAPSMTEHAFLKPQAYIMLFKVHPIFYPMHLLCYPFFLFSKNRNLKQPVKGHTTNKISLLPTMKLLKHKLPSKEYMSSVYRRYFGKPGSHGHFIGESVYLGLIK